MTKTKDKAVIYYTVMAEEDGTKRLIGEFPDLNECEQSAVKYIERNPDATVFVTQLHNRYWTCSSTGKIRNDYKEEIEDE